jgi:hypothetical protein
VNDLEQAAWQRSSRKPAHYYAEIARADPTGFLGEIRRNRGAKKAAAWAARAGRRVPKVFSIARLDGR